MQLHAAVTSRCNIHGESGCIICKHCASSVGPCGLPMHWLLGQYCSWQAESMKGCCSWWCCGAKSAVIWRLPGICRAHCGPLRVDKPIIERTNSYAKPSSSSCQDEVWYAFFRPESDCPAGTATKNKYDWSRLVPKGFTSCMLQQRKLRLPLPEPSAGRTGELVWQLVKLTQRCKFKTCF